jgi:mono/diheme cytochrome c family protein
MRVESEKRVDYRETENVTRVHAAVEREKAEPTVGEMTFPLWLLAVFGACIFLGALYLGMFSGGFSGGVYDETAGTGALFGKQGAGGGGAAAAVTRTPAELGKIVFNQNCAQCHQATGMGVAGQYPPLAGSDWVTGSEKRVTMIVLKGLHGPFTVKGQTFNSVMQAWEKTLTDKKIAQVLTYIRSEWGNAAGEILPEQVAVARKEFASRTDAWTQADIEAVPPDATLPKGGGAAPVPAAAGAATPAVGVTGVPAPAPAATPALAP